MSADLNERTVKYAARIVYEEVNFYPSRVTQHKVGDEWVVEEIHEMEESDREQIYEEVLHESVDQPVAKEAFETAIRRFKSKALEKDQLNDLIKAISHGFQQPEADALRGIPELKAVLIETVHSMNRKELIPNEHVDKFIELLIMEMGI